MVCASAYGANHRTHETPVREPLPCLTGCPCQENEEGAGDGDSGNAIHNRPIGFTGRPFTQTSK
jgi:hypothetical protein